MLPKASDEQLDIIKSIKDKNVLIDSVAGSGKTTTNLLIAINNEKDSILILTYNKKLKFETREKVSDLNLENTEVHSYHSFCVKYLDRKCITDHGIIRMLKKDSEPIKSYYYDIIIIDEAQDMTQVYYQLVCKIVKHNGKYPKIAVLGDKYQSIYDFNKADPRYISFADKIFTFGDREWARLNLSTSFRLTVPVVKFINSCVLKENRLNSIKPSSYKPRYIICDSFGNSKNNAPLREIDILKWDTDTVIFLFWRHP